MNSSTCTPKGIANGRHANCLFFVTVLICIKQTYLFTIFRCSATIKKSNEILAELSALEKIPFTLTAEELVAAYDKEREEVEEPLQSVGKKCFFFLMS